MTFLLLCALILFFVRAIRTRDLFEMVFGVVVLLLFFLRIAGVVRLPQGLGG